MYFLCGRGHIDVSPTYNTFPVGSRRRPAVAWAHMEPSAPWRMLAARKNVLEPSSLGPDPAQLRSLVN